MEPRPPADAGPPKKPLLLGAAFVVFTLAFAFFTAWPFLTAWQLRYSPAYLASRDWVLKSESIGEIVGPNRYAENDTFPKGGYSGETEGAEARFEHKLVGDKDKAKFVVLLTRRGGDWVPTGLARESGTSEWAELPVR